MVINVEVKDRASSLEEIRAKINAALNSLADSSIPLKVPAGARPYNFSLHIEQEGHYKVGQEIK
jgi:hypothetical protein